MKCHPRHNCCGPHTAPLQHPRSFTLLPSQAGDSGHQTAKQTTTRTANIQQQSKTTKCRRPTRTAAHGESTLARTHRHIKKNAHNNNKRKPKRARAKHRKVGKGVGSGGDDNGGDSMGGGEGGGGRHTHTHTRNTHTCTFGRGARFVACVLSVKSPEQESIGEENRQGMGESPGSGRAMQCWRLRAHQRREGETITARGKKTKNTKRVYSEARIGSSHLHQRKR